MHFQLKATEKTKQKDTCISQCRAKGQPQFWLIANSFLIQVTVRTCIEVEVESHYSVKSKSLVKKKMYQTSVPSLTWELTSISKVLHQQYLIERLHAVRGWRRALSPLLHSWSNPSPNDSQPIQFLPGWHSSLQMAWLCLSIREWSGPWLIGGRSGCSNDETMLINSNFLGPMCEARCVPGMQRMRPLSAPSLCTFCSNVSPYGSVTQYEASWDRPHLRPQIRAVNDEVQ